MLAIRANSWHDPMALKDRTTDILNDLNKEYRVKYKTTCTKEVKKILHIRNPRKTASSIKEDVESQLQETCFKHRFIKLNRSNNAVFLYLRIY